MSLIIKKIIRADPQYMTISEIDNWLSKKQREGWPSSTSIHLGKFGLRKKPRAVKN